MQINLAKLSNEIDFTKTVLEDGDPDVVAEEGECFEIEAKLMFDKSVLKTNEHDADTLIGFTLNSDHSVLVRQRLGYFNSQICKILHGVIRGMRLNEKAHVSFELDPYLLDESFQQHETKNEKIFFDLKFELRLVKIENNQRLVYKLDESQLMAVTNEHKADANELFKKHLILTAFHRYHKAINYTIIAEQKVNERNGGPNEELETIPESDAILLSDILKIKSQLYANLAACQLKNKSYKLAVLNCTKCLEIDPSNVKALFRRSSAYSDSNDYELAIEDLKRAIGLEPENLEVKKKLTYVESLKKNYEHSMANKFKKMFQ